MTATTVQRYVKRPVEIEAVQVDATNVPAVGMWAGAECRHDHLIIHTLEGDVRANLTDWVIKGVAGEFYPCRDDIFGATYDSAE